ncbi:MAG TPA: hypothetical protein VMV79_08655 [Alphaproteobacteria bacterium]|nr:hypothetical protein [Alphaproteobacteria bacterium]
MSYIGKLVDLTTVGGTVTGIALLQRLIPRLAIIVALTIISSMMIVALMMAGFYAVYAGLLSYGLTSGAAMAATGGIALLVTLLLVGVTVIRMRQIRDVRRALLNMPIVAEAVDLADAFVEGFLSRQ